MGVGNGMYVVERKLTETTSMRRGGGGGLTIGIFLGSKMVVGPDRVVF